MGERKFNELKQAVDYISTCFSINSLFKIKTFRLNKYWVVVIK